MVEECSGCQGDSHFYTCARAVGPYEDLWKAVLYQFKYRGKVSLSTPIGELMTEIILKDKRYHGLDVIVPVPISSEKAEDRLFNQAELLAWQISSYLRRPLCTKVLYRKGGTKIQAKLTKEERKRNLQDAFEVMMKQHHISAVQGKNVLLVDDVLTTGGTANLCSKLLLKLGAKEVMVLTWATGSSSVKKNFNI
jgi:ComF family protein